MVFIVSFFNHFTIWKYTVWDTDKSKGKAVPLQAWTAPECSRKLRFPNFVTTAQDFGNLSTLRTGRLYLLTLWCRVLLEKLTGLQLVKKFPVFHGTRRFFTALTGVRHLSLSWASPIQSIYPHPTSWRSIVILSTHLRLGLPIGLLPFGFPTKTLYTPSLLTHTRHMPSPSHSSRFYHPHHIGWGVQIT